MVYNHSKHLKALMRKDIAASVDIFANLSDEIREIYGLSDTPIEIVVGCDVESMLFQGDEMIAGSRWQHLNNMRWHGRHPKAEEFIKRSIKELGDVFYFSERDRNKAPVFFDDKRIEANLQTAGAMDAVDNFNDYNARSCAIAEDMGLKFVAGPGHWHVTLWQDGKNLIDAHEDHPRFALHAASGLAMMQEHMSALFVRPRIADMNGDGSIGSCAVEAIDICDDYESIRFNHLTSGVITLENRLADGSPEQCLALTLKGLLFGLKCNGFDPHLNQDHWVQHMTLEDYGTVVVDTDLYQTKKIQAGAYGFDKFMDALIENDVIYDFYEPEAADLLILDTIKRYREYLTWSSATERYCPTEIDRLDERLADLELEYAAAIKSHALTSLSTKSTKEKAPLGKLGFYQSLDI